MLIKQLALTLLGALLLVQNSYAAPVNATTIEDVIENVLKIVDNRFKLFGTMIVEYTAIFNLLQEKAAPILQKVIEDPKVLAVKTEAMEENISMIRNMLKDLEKDDTKTGKPIPDTLKEFGDIINKFDKEKNGNLSEDEEIIYNSLKANGYEDFDTAILNHLKEFFETFKKDLGTYIEGLNQKERKTEEDLIDWYEKLKVETSAGKQFIMFDKFMTETFKDSDESDD